MAYDPTIIKTCPSILRMDKRLCRTDVQCCWYDPAQDGQPCTESIDQCDYIQKLLDENDSDEIYDLQGQVESREDQITDLEEDLKHYKKLADSLPDLQAQLTKVSGQLSNLQQHMTPEKD